MTTAEKKAKTSEVTARLKGLLESISQFVEYIPEDEQKALLHLLEEWKHPERRNASRKHCAIPVDFVVDGRAFAGSIKDIGLRGVHIESVQKFDVGQEITLTFAFPGLSKPLKTLGRIVWSRDKGFGVNIEMPTRYLEEYIGKTIEGL